MANKRNIMKRTILTVSILMFAALVGGMAADKTVYKQGEKNSIDNNHYFTYEYDHKPKIGYVILIIKAFDKAGARLTDYSITGVSGMPAMPSMGSTPETLFKLNKKGNYLLPIYASMLGTWQTNIKIIKDKKLISTGVISFDVK